MKKLVKCNLCGHEWETKSDYIFVTCPNCQRKTRAREDPKEYEEEFEDEDEKEDEVDVVNVNNEERKKWIQQ